VPGGGLSPDHTRWISSRPNFFLPVKVLSRVFRGKFCSGLRRAFSARQLAFFGDCLPLAEERNFKRFLRTLFQHDWVVYSKPPFGGPDHVLQYLARYTHRVAISNHRILSVTESEVRFRWKDYANHSKKRTMTLTGAEFLRRFLQHVLPKAFPRIRYFGWLANRKRGPALQLCRALLQQTPESVPATSDEPTARQCPRCHGPMRIIERLTVEEIKNDERSPVLVVDTC
jgi:Putative transposase